MIFSAFEALGSEYISNFVIPAKYFTNHDKELEDLSNKLENYNKAAVVGISGIGKTQLVRMYAEKNHGQYKLIWFFDCNSDLSEQFLELIKKINHSEENKLLEDPKNAKNIVKDYLTSRKGWLLVFDNLRLNQNDQIKDIIDWEHNGHMIICSQDASGFTEVIQLPHLNLDNSKTLVKKVLKSPDTTLINELSEIFQGYPLWIVQGAMFLRENRYMKTSDYKDLLMKADNKPEMHIKLVLQQLPESSKNLMCKIAVLNNHLVSKNILENTLPNNKELSKDLYNLKRFGLIGVVGENDNQQIFEMHDMIKDTILGILELDTIKANITEIIDRLNLLTPKSVVNRYLVLTEDSTIRGSLEVLLANAESYNIDITKVIELRKNLMGLYLNSLDYYNCQKMADWLLAKKEDKDFIELIKADKDKVTYAEYIIDIGVYEDFAKTDYINATRFLEEARNVLDNISGYPEVKFTVYAQLAQIYAFGGDLVNSENKLNVIEQLISSHQNVEFDLGLYWFIRAKNYLSQGYYDKAKYAIEKNIEVESHLPQNTFTAPTYILQSEILNFMGLFSTAQQISKRIYDQETNSIKDEHEIHSRILTQLSRAELGLGKFDEALIYIDKAINILTKKDKITDSVELSNSHNTDLASALLVKAEILASMGNQLLSLEFYSMAETVFYNRYRNNMYNLDNVGYLYAMASEASCNLGEPFWYNKFSNKLIKQFGKNHPRTQQVLAKCQK